MKRCEYKLGRFFQVFKDDDVVVRSPRIKRADDKFNRPVVNLAQVFYEGVSEIKNMAGDVSASSNQQQELSDIKKHFWKLKNRNRRLCQNSKKARTEIYYKLGQKFCSPRPRFWEVET